MRSHQTTIHPRSPGSLVIGSPDHRPMEPQVTGLPWSLGHWVIGLLGHSKFIHPSIHYHYWLHLSKGQGHMVSHTSKGHDHETTYPPIHPDQGQMATHLSRVTGSGSPSIHPSRVMVTRAIHPDHRTLYPSSYQGQG
jgi:hypothetical protein